MLKYNTLLIVLFEIFLLSALVYSLGASPHALATSTGPSIHTTLASPRLISSQNQRLSTSGGVAPGAHFRATKVMHFRPSGIRGTLATPVDCWETSLAAPRANAWRCIERNRIYDPCFSTSPQANYVICDANPSNGTRGLKAILAHPLPSGVYSSGMQAWMMRLSDGSVCAFYTGATGLIGGERINYGCTNGANLVGSPRIGTVWMVKEMKQGRSRLLMTPVVEVWW